MEIKIINQCPKCNSEDINYFIDIFKKPTQKEYYTGECECETCKHKFNRKDIIEKKWVAVDNLHVSRMFDANKKPVWGINLNEHIELAKALSTPQNPIYPDVKKAFMEKDCSTCHFERSCPIQQDSRDACKLWHRKI